MRKHDVRKWLHAILDLLPVILIPVFMIYSHRHTINDGSIQVQEKIAVDFNQLVINGAPTSTDNYYVQPYGSLTYEDSSLLYQVTSIAPEGYNQAFGNYYWRNEGIQIYANHVYLSSCYITVSRDCRIQFGGSANYGYYDFNNEPSHLCQFRFTSSTTEQGNRYFYISNFNNEIGSWFKLTNNQLFDLTQMFGVGNEPTIEEFNNMFTNSYYQYTLSHKVLVDGDLVTYNDTDIMSQFTYQLYNSVDKYFNMGNVFHLNEVYDWFNLNIFNGQAPIYIFIVYQIVLYELIMDLLMLLYSLFMWFIDMIEKLMEKPLNSVK